MTYATSRLHGPVNIGLGMNMWALDTVDVTTDVDGAGFISDGGQRGMQKGDLVWVRIWTTAIPATSAEMMTAAGTANILTAMGMHVVLGISTTGPGYAADLTNVTALTMTNSD
jgi:hypothetical protein